MYPASLFPKSLFPYQLFPGPGEAPEDAALNIFGALRARAEATPGLIDLLPGGVWQDSADQEGWDDPPFAVITQVGHESIKTTGPRQHIIEMMQVAFYGPTRDELDACIRAWHNTFGPTMDPMLVLEPTGDGKNYVVVNRPVIERGDVGINPSGQSLRMHVLEFNAFPNGT